MKRIILLISLMVIGLTHAFASSSWSVHLSYPDVSAITQSENKIYALSEGAMFSLDKHDNTIETFSILNGLNDSDIKLIRFSEDDNTLMIVYSNSNIDLMNSKGIFNLSEFKTKDMTGSKRINQIKFSNGAAFLAADFGILKVDLKKKEFSDTYHPTESTAITDLNFCGDKIYAMTEKSLLSANVNEKLLANPEKWTAFDNLPQAHVANKQIASFENHIFLLKADSSLYYLNEREWVLFGKKVASINTSQNRLNVTCAHSAKSYTSLLNEPNYISTDSEIAESVYDNAENTFYTAAIYNGIGKIKEANDTHEQSQSFYTVNGPLSNKAYTMKFVGDRLFVIPIGTWIDGSNSEEGVLGMVMIYDGKYWKNVGAPNFADPMDIAVDPQDNTHFWVGTYALGGLFEFRDDRFYVRYNAENTDGIIENVFGNDKYIITDGLNYDQNGDLWFTQMAATYPIKVRRHDGTWEQYKDFSKINGYGNTMRGNMLDVNGSRWIFTPRANFIFVYDTSTKRNVYRTSFTDQDGNKFSSERFRCIATDRENPQEIWLGSIYGPIIIPNAKNFYSSDAIRRIKIPRNDGSGLADYLLGNEMINHIVVDAANRKWIATRTSGAYLVSPDGTETIKHFTTQNSPLLGDNVYNIAINSNTGEVFFCTDKGICSYMGDANDGRENYDDVHAFPNPVREDYEGEITITGLMDKSSVKITDVSGNLIYETISNGGMATWDGTDRSGERVATGVYLALCFSENTKKSAICKILVINK